MKELEAKKDGDDSLYIAVVFFVVGCFCLILFSVKHIDWVLSAGLICLFISLVGYISFRYFCLKGFILKELKKVKKK